MRWKNKPKEIGDKRVVRKFLFFPTLINGEWRWLEWAEIQQVYTLGGYMEPPYWDDDEWVDQPGERTE